MKIIWNQVTWYSKLIAVILFLAVFVIAFKLGEENQKIKSSYSQIKVDEYVKQEKKEEIIPLANGEFCYSRLQLATKEEPYKVEESIKLNILNNVISGTKTGIQEGPDMYNGYRGTLEGNYKNNEMELVFAYEIEGSQGKEIEIYKKEGEDLNKLRWELSLTDEGFLVPSRLGEPKIIKYANVNCSQIDQIQRKEEIINSSFELLN